MIDGIWIKVTVDELRTHLKARADHHRQKGNAFSRMATDLGGTAPPTAANNSPIDDLNRRSEDHLAKSLKFSFLADRLIDDPDGYKLTVSHCEDLEFISHRYLQ